MSTQQNTYILASDIGGSHITSAIVNCKDWTILTSTLYRREVNSLADAKSIIQQWTINIIESMQAFEKDIFQLSFAIPAPFDYENGISYMRNQNKYDALYECNISAALIQKLNKGSLSIKYLNDAAAFLQGEIFAQGLHKSSCSLGITLGTGLGSAYWIQGQQAIDADLWQAPYRESIFEDYLTTRWFTSRFAELTGENLSGLKEILQTNKYQAEKNLLIQEFQTAFADFLAFFTEKHPCTTIIIGGNMANAWELFEHPFLFKEYTLIPAIYHEKAALIGAASLFSIL